VLGAERTGIQMAMATGLITEPAEIHLKCPHQPSHEWLRIGLLQPTLEHVSKQEWETVHF
jgi:hypothetical protein